MPGGDTTVGKGLLEPITHRQRDDQQDTKDKAEDSAEP